MNNDTPIKVTAHAKINLHLRVRQKRSDGYHELETVFQELALADTLIISSHRERLSLAIRGIEVPSGDDNLVIKAAKLLQKTAGIKRGAHIELHKNIPTEAGLGGGSSDAAATLKGLNRLWKLQIPLQQLHPLAALLGADVPFFLTGGAAFATGRGDVIRPLPKFPHTWVLLIKPAFSISTRHLFQIFKPPLTKECRALNINALTDAKTFCKELQRKACNDLEGTARQLHPELRYIASKLLESGAFFSQMTGSGSTMYGLFTTREMRDAAASMDCWKGSLVIKTSFKS